MKIKKLTTQFLLNYIFIFIIITVLGLTTFYFFSMYDNWEQDHYAIDMMQLEEDYFAEDLDYAISNQQFQENDKVMVLTRDREVIASYNGDKPVGENYSEQELQELLYGEDYVNYMVFYSLDEENIFVLYTVYIEPNMQYILGLFVFFIVVFGTVAIGFAKYTSNQILYPIKALVSGVQHIRDGDYDTHIAFNASNELNILKDEINHMSQTIKNETEKRTQLEENRKQLIRDLSHDIRTPLTNIMGYSEKLVSDDSFVSEDQRQSIEIIHQYGTSANYLINELFDLSKLELEDESFSLQEIDMSEWLRLKLIDYINEFERKAIDYDFKVPDKAICLPVNELNLNRLVDNLLLNAMNYNDRGFAMYIGFENLDASYVLTIADDGIGIPDEIIDRIFEPMVRVEDSRNRNLGGTGLGLSIVKQIVEKHGWTIQLLAKEASYFEHGCTFVITMPK